MDSLKVGICGLGTVASGVINVLKRNQFEISSRVGCNIEVVQVASRRMRDNCDMTGIEFTTDINDLVNNPDLNVVAELIGGYDLAKEIVEKALRNGKHVVTANKALIAEHGNELFALAEENNVFLAYEAGVAGAIPIIKAVREGLAANKIQGLAGIINGTGNFILTEMKNKGREFSDVLSEAQELGYAEADPTFDVEGIDAAHKLAILSSVAFGAPLQFSKTFTEGISKISPEDLRYAEELGYRVKHLGITRRQESGIELRVHPALIPENQLIAKVDGVMNAVLVESDAAAQTMYYGPGAGSEATASAVIADICDIARSVKFGTGPIVPGLGFTSSRIQNLPVLDISECNSAFYLRISAEDHPGVLAEVCSVMSKHGINIESLLQKEKDQVGDLIPLVMLTREVREAQMNQAIEAIEALGSVSGSVQKIRVAQFA